MTKSSIDDNRAMEIGLERLFEAVISKRSWQGYAVGGAKRIFLLQDSHDSKSILLTISGDFPMSNEKRGITAAP